MGKTGNTALPTEFETLSSSAAAYLQKQGFSSKLVFGVRLMLRECGGAYAQWLGNKVWYKSGNTIRYRQLYHIGKKPRMPDSLAGWTRVTYHRGKKLLMPDIGTYHTTLYHIETWNALSSKEGQRFMKRYYDGLQRIGVSSFWEIIPPKKKVGKPVKHPSDF